MAQGWWPSESSGPPHQPAWPGTAPHIGLGVRGTKGVQLGLCLPLHEFMLPESDLEVGVWRPVSLFFDLKVLFLETANGSNRQVLKGAGRCVWAGARGQVRVLHPFGAPPPHRCQEEVWTSVVRSQVLLSDPSRILGVPSGPRGRSCPQHQAHLGTCGWTMCLTLWGCLPHPAKLYPSAQDSGPPASEVMLGLQTTVCVHGRCP